MGCMDIQIQVSSLCDIGMIPNQNWNNEKKISMMPAQDILDCPYAGAMLIFLLSFQL
jgi:hypothetical protein